MGITNVMNTGKSGLFANRASLATTGHNIANVNTEGYSRQRVEQVASAPHPAGAINVGTGVHAVNIHRINDEYLTMQIANEMKNLGQYEEKDMAMAQTGNIFNEINDSGVNKLMANFFNEFRKLGNEPESEAMRVTVRESADQLIGDFHRISTSIRDVQKNVDVRIEANVRQVNELVQRVAHLNEDIKRLELKAGETGDLRDSRDNCIKKLSTIIDISVASNEKGELTIGIANGVGPLVSGSQFNVMSVQKMKGDGEAGTPEGALQIRVENFASPDITHKLVNGRLGGLVESRDSIIGKMMKRVDELAFVFSQKVNEIHRQGYNMNNGTGTDFFKELDSVEGAAAAMSLSAAVRDDANNIATALGPDSPGDNRLVQQIARLQHMRVMSGGRSTFDDHFNATVADLATINAKNKSVLDHQGHIVSQLEKFREAVAGVSLDEETTNLVQFQHAFDACAKVIKVADEMLESVLRMRG
ncbi:MAG: flagellar hook-associated protein FlgK [Deltaproteobacteria bacterium]|nr:flagellar hook-associated protein FlgK [Deltaproteobacteria bacterium]